MCVWGGGSVGGMAALKGDFYKGPYAHAVQSRPLRSGKTPPSYPPPPRAYGGKGQVKGKGSREGRIGQRGGGRQGGERPMGTTAYGGKGSKGRRSANRRRQLHTRTTHHGDMPNPPPPPPWGWGGRGVKKQVWVPTIGLQLRAPPRHFLVCRRADNLSELGGGGVGWGLPRLWQISFFAGTKLVVACFAGGGGGGGMQCWYFQRNSVACVSWRYTSSLAAGLSADAWTSHAPPPRDVLERLYTVGGGGVPPPWIPPPPPGPPPPPPLPMFETDSQNSASAPLAPRGFKLKLIFGPPSTGTIGGPKQEGGPRSTPPPFNLRTTVEPDLDGPASARPDEE